MADGVYGDGRTPLHHEAVECVAWSSYETKNKVTIVSVIDKLGKGWILASRGS